MPIFDAYSIRHICINSKVVTITWVPPPDAVAEGWVAPPKNFFYFFGGSRLKIFFLNFFQIPQGCCYSDNANLGRDKFFLYLFLSFYIDIILYFLFMLLFLCFLI